MAASACCACGSPKQHIEIQHLPGADSHLSSVHEQQAHVSAAPLSVEPSFRAFIPNFGVHAPHLFTNFRYSATLCLAWAGPNEALSGAPSVSASPQCCAIPPCLMPLDCVLQLTIIRGSFRQQAVRSMRPAEICPTLHHGRSRAGTPLAAVKAAPEKA